MLPFSGLLLMVIGGSRESSYSPTQEPGVSTTTSLPGGYINAVELVSLDPDNNPVPPCLTNLNDFPIGIDGAAGSVGEGNLIQYTL